MTVLPVIPGVSLRGAVTEPTRRLCCPKESLQPNGAVEKSQGDTTLRTHETVFGFL